MRIFPLLVTLGVAAGVGARDGARPALEEEIHVAIVCAMTGASELVAPERRPLRLFDWLAPGSSLEVGRDSSLSLAFWNGARFELGSGARGRIGRVDLEKSSGPVRQLLPLPRLPVVAGIRDSDSPGARSGAVRVRDGGAIRGLYPRAGCATLASDTQLRFRPVPGARGYRVQIEDESGAVILERQLAASPLRVPPGVLAAGSRYYWRVRARVDFGPTPSGAAAFVTLSSEQARRRALVRQALAADGGSDALLAGLDLGLNLWLEARDELSAALERSPDDPALARALDEIEKRLATEDERDDSLERP